LVELDRTDNINFQISFCGIRSINEAPKVGVIFLLGQAQNKPYERNLYVKGILKN
jgi:hypothetical protein